MTTDNQNLDYQTYSKLLPAVKAYMDELEQQDLWWSTVGMVGKINNENIDSQLLVSIVDTQAEFQKLRDLMTEELINRYINQANSQIKLKAQNTIDIVIRNLFERTADVGFLATDEDLVEFLSLAEPSSCQQEFILQRLNEYVAKYSVYDDVLLVRPNGEIAAKLDSNNHTKHSSDTLIREAITTQNEYIEVYRHSDLFPNKKNSLIYAKKIETRPESGKPEVVGVLCLSFDFDDEMKGIFETLGSNHDYQLMIIDQDQKVIASNNSKQNPIGKQAKINENQLKTPTNVGNTIQYMTKTTGYQGFKGLPWSSYVAINSESAFKQNDNENMPLLKIDQTSPLYLHDLEEFNLKVSTLLLIVILNGKIMSLKRDVRSFLPILDRFQQISIEIQDIFSRFIDHIHDVLLETVSAKVAFSAALAVDIMDRNLYERANDCRWWALNSSFRKIMSKKANGEVLTSTDKENLTNILTYINKLYTVYTNIFIYDQNGTIIAVSNPEDQKYINSKIDISDCKRCLNLNDTQHYIVSSFHQSELYDQRYTYLYHAPIKDWENMDINVGGIGLVFDSDPEFKAMLNETKPSYAMESIQKASFSCYVDRSGLVISSTSENIKIGTKLSLPMEVLEAENGKVGTIQWQFQEKTHLLGYKISSGYREYKVSDNYQNDVISIVASGV